MCKRSSFGFRFVLCLALLVPVAFIVFEGCSNDDPVSSDLPELVVYPQTVTVSSIEGVTNLDRVGIKVDCEPSASVHFSFDCESSWLSVTNMAGTDYGTTRDSFALAFTVHELDVGTYVDSVCVTSAGVTNSPQYVEVTYTILERPPDLAVYPHLLIFEADGPDDIVPPDSFRVACGDGSNMPFTVETSADWITLSATASTTPDTIEVTVDPSVLTTGSHVDTIWVVSDEMSESPQAVVCSLATPSWLQQTSPIQDHHLEDVIFADLQTGWAVGFVEGDSRTGYLIETFDGGANWDTRLFLNAETGEDSALSAIDFADGNVWTVGESGTVYHSPDVGVTWNHRIISLPDPTATLRGVDFVNGDIGWIVGDGGLILKTEDGGDTWNQQISNSGETLLDICFVGENDGWVTGYGGTLLHTSDGGDTWAPLTMPLSNCRDVFFINASSGWLVGANGAIWHTMDGGENWQTQASGVTAWLQSVFFIDENVGWIAGGNVQSGVVLYTDDAGANWKQQTTGTGFWLYGVHFVNDQCGWVVGDYGEIRYTTSGGN